MRRLLAHAAMLMAAQPPAEAQDFPERWRPIMLIVPYTPGGGVDFVARATGSGRERELGLSVVVSNRPGGGAQIGLSSLVRARPDGHTLALDLPLVQRLRRSPRLMGRGPHGQNTISWTGPCHRASATSDARGSAAKGGAAPGGTEPRRSPPWP
jgi:hypothetical protein